MLFFKKVFLFYLPVVDKYIVIKAGDESTAVWKLCNHYRKKEHLIKDYIIIENCKIIK